MWNLSGYNINLIFAYAILFQHFNKHKNSIIWVRRAHLSEVCRYVGISHPNGTHTANNSFYRSLFFIDGKETMLYDVYPKNWTHIN